MTKGQERITTNFFFAPTGTLVFMLPEQRPLFQIWSNPAYIYSLKWLKDPTCAIFFTQEPSVVFVSFNLIDVKQGYAFG